MQHCSTCVPAYCTSLCSHQFYSKYIKRPVSGERTLTTAASAAERKTTPHTSHGERAAEKRKSKSLSPISSHCTEETDSDLRSEVSGGTILLQKCWVGGYVVLHNSYHCDEIFNKYIICCISLKRRHSYYFISVLPQFSVYLRAPFIRGWRLNLLRVLMCNLVPSTFMCQFPADAMTDRGDFFIRSFMHRFMCTNLLGSPS